MERARVVEFLRHRGPGFAADLMVNVVLPFAIYHYASPHYGDVDALLASSLPPILWSIVEFIRVRRVDALSMLVLAGIVLSLLALIGGGSAKWLQLREKLVTGVIGLAFVISAMIRRPLVYVLARAATKRAAGGNTSEIDALRDDVGFRRTMTLITVVWGCGLLVDVAVSVALVFLLPIGTYLIVNPILGYGTIGILMLWTYWYSRSLPD